MLKEPADGSFLLPTLKRLVGGLIYEGHAEFNGKSAKQ